VSSLTLTDSRALLVQVVQRLYAERHSPLPGALVKAQLLAETASKGATFSEGELGFRNFLAFVKTVPDVAVQIRMGSDMLLAPASAADTLSAYARPLPRLRRDFWRAFIEFPVPNTARIYDPVEDKIFYEIVPTTRDGTVIEPISRSDQIAWRRNFSEEQPENVRGLLLASLEGSGTAIFNDFARRLRENPSVMRAWNHYLQKQITDHVAAWATVNNVPEDRWCGGISRNDGSGSTANLESRPQTMGQRSELYNFLDNIPIEDLLQLRVPLEWMLRATREKK
jgi:hypothetical protein